MEIVLTELAEFDSVVDNGALRVSRFTLAKNVSDCSYKSELATTLLAFSKSVTFCINKGSSTLMKMSSFKPF